MDSKNTSFPLNKLHSQKLDGHSLHLGEVRQLRLSGWKGFKLYLRSPGGELSTFPAIKGIYSTSGKEGVKPWMDLDYREELAFSASEKDESTFSLRANKKDRILFKKLGDIIPPGGHLMVSYEGDQRIHQETIKSLSLRIPPAATPLGHLIWQAGFQFIKDWYLAEGGFEGPRKLWGEKAPDEVWEKKFSERTAQQLRDFLERKPSSWKDLEDSARQRAKEILAI